MFGTKDAVDPVQHLIGKAIDWGGNPNEAAVYQSAYPARNDGKTVHRLTVKDVPVDGFWSISLYNAKGFALAFSIALSFGAFDQAHSQDADELFAKSPAQFLDAVAKQAGFNDPAEPTKIVGPVHFVGTRTRCLADNHLRGSYSAEYRHARIRSDDRGVNSQA